MDETNEMKQIIKLSIRMLEIIEYLVGVWNFYKILS